MKTRVLSLAAMVCTILLFSCKKEDRTVPIQIWLTDNPATYKEVNVDIQSVQVKVNDDSEPWITLDTKVEEPINLLDYQNGVKMVLSDGEVPAGVLKEVRFILGPNNTVVTDDDVSHALQAPSAESSGLKVKIDKALNYTANSFVLDFDAALSVSEENGGYKLSPVIKLKEQ